MQQRYAGAADIVYHDVSHPEIRSEHADEVAIIQDQGLIYPVTFIDGQPLYDGAVSYPAIMRAVENVMAETAKG
jgi:disulfide oxidoreductase YuzD